MLSVQRLGTGLAFIVGRTDCHEIGSWAMSVVITGPALKIFLHYCLNIQMEAGSTDWNTARPIRILFVTRSMLSFITRSYQSANPKYCPMTTDSSFLP
jgi:hypothetical protein